MVINKKKKRLGSPQKRHGLPWTWCRDKKNGKRPGSPQKRRQRDRTWTWRDKKKRQEAKQPTKETCLDWDVAAGKGTPVEDLSLIHISEPTRLD
eukprot:5901901-Prorocentrum_lima.AAC.1